MAIFSICSPATAFVPPHQRLFFNGLNRCTPLNSSYTSLPLSYFKASPNPLFSLSLSLSPLLLPFHSATMNPTREINGIIRPSSLQINNRDSNHIKKPTVQSMDLSNSPLSSTSRHQPVIIYTHSPKIIHADACDFMALVQRLTGFSGSSGSSGSSNGDNSDSIPSSPNHDDKRRKTCHGNKKEESIKSSPEEMLQVMAPRQWPASDAPSFMEEFRSECIDSPNSIYRWADLSGISSTADINCSSSRFFGI